MNLKNSEEKQEYLTEKLDRQLTEVNDKYGEVLVNELISRLEDTIKNFNSEMNILFEDLKRKELQRQEMLDLVKSGQNLVEETITDTQKDSNGKSVSEWEKRLEEIETKDKE